MINRSPTRWGTPFGRFVSEFKAHRLARAISAQLNYEIHDTTIYHWVAGRHLPRPDHMNAIVTLSGGRVTVEDVYSHHRAMTSSHAGGGGPGASR